MVSALVAGLLATVGAAVPASAQSTYPFRNPNLPLERRVDDLMGRLTLDEKIGLLHQYQAPIPRLGIKRVKNGTEALHGLAWSNDFYNNGSTVTATATTFPQAIGLASTWNPALIKQVGSAVGSEARGYNSENPLAWGLNLWAPVVDPLRDPRAGRNEEGYSEDPYLTGTMATAYAGGMRGDHPKYLKTAPTVKHYLGYNNEFKRSTTSSSLRPRAKKEYYETGFRMPIQAGVATGVMMSYNLVNGRPATAHADANDVVRAWTDETLMNVTDAFAPNNLIGSQRYYSTLAQADAATLKAGVDSFTTDDTNSARTINAIKSALAQGLLAESDVNTAARNLLSIRFRLGEFDPDGGPYAKITKDVVNSPTHQRLARKAAAESMVLLKNSDRTLPLDPAKTDKIAVVGPLTKSLYSDWYGGNMPYKVTPLDGIKAKFGSGATIADTEAVDRIALREVTTGKYVTAGSDADGENLTVSGTGVAATEQFDVFGWGQGVLTLRSVANGMFVERANFGATSPFVNRADQPRGWFVQQQFKLEGAGDGSYVIRYAGHETPNSWEGPNNYLTVADDGRLILGAPTAATAARFQQEMISSGIESAVRAVTGADAAVVVVGSMPFINGREDFDRTTMALAENQSELIKAVHRANPNTIVVVENSYPTTLNWEQQNIPAILWTTHAGQETGNALADVLFGDVNPAGRLTQTWYKSEADLPDILEYDIIKADRTYLYDRSTPLYPFGHGLSYTTFRYGDLRLSAPVLASGGTVTVSVDVTNTGQRAGDEVVQLYTHQRTSRDKQPVKALRGFQRVHLGPGETKTVYIPLRATDLVHWDVTRDKWVLESSVHDMMVGGSSADIRQGTTLRVVGEKIPPRDLSKETRAANFDDYAGIELVDETKVRGDAVGRIDAGDWIKFADVNLGRGVSSFTARVSRVDAGNATIQIRLDDPVTGPVIGTAQVTSTGDIYRYETTTASLTRVSGRHDIYLVFSGDLRISTFSVR
ncbi:beta-glucosidase [Micromonospora deserti]|uniref:Exo-alpha-(1->6)-L-arabinopyranosidase n=1 Tax=Micromonospora deserti TaxID=2070366 RepID=A0A2W2DX80_9ACTN|nr:beta-glucosidase [Micromonospora deserti]